MNTDERKTILKALNQMKSDSVQNYVIPGLSSHLLNNGMVRLLESERNHREQVTPHSHRFDLTCLVLSGCVTNTLWTKSGFDQRTDVFMVSELHFQGKIGEFEKFEQGTVRYKPNSQQFEAGEVYTMTHNEIHSIEFSKDCTVLFLEGPKQTNKSVLLEPVVNNEVVPTGDVLPWMFKR